MADATHTESLTVVTPCTCNGTHTVRAWWNCRTSTTVAEYRYVPEDDCGPSDRDLAWLREQHPGCDLIYIGPGR